MPTIAADRNAAADGQTGGVSSHPAAATDALRQQRNRIRARHEHRCRNRRSLGRIDRDLTAIAAGCAGATGPEETSRAAIAAATADALHDGAMPEIAGRPQSAGSCRAAEGQGRATAGARKPAATRPGRSPRCVPALAAAAAIGLDEDRLPTCLTDAG